MPNSGGRTPSYISPSALKTFEKDAADYYIKYLCPTRVPRMPQTEPMAVGSAFDAFVKSFLHHSLFGNFGPDDAYAKIESLRNKLSLMSVMVHTPQVSMCLSVT